MLYLFEDFTLDTDKYELRRAGKLVALEPQVFDLLELLIRSRDRVVSRDEMIEAVWHGRIVSESTLSSRINAVRTAIGDNGETQRLIKTLPRKGIRFAGSVREETATSSKPPEPASTPSAHSPLEGGPSIAVLPFTNMGSDTEGDYFADGMVEEIITALSRCSSLLVIARNSSFVYKGRAVDVRQVGRELAVGYVLEGSVRRSQQRLRVTAQLIETSGGTHIWADKFDGDFNDVFDLQDRIAESTAAVIEPKLQLAEVERARRRPPQNMDAYELWLRALSLADENTANSMAAALDCLNRALQIDPSYAAAMAYAAYCHAQCHSQGWVPLQGEAKDRAVQLARDAVRLAYDDANVLGQAAHAIWTLEQNAVRAQELLRRSLEINPNSPIALTTAGWIQAAIGDPTVGRKMLERSQRLNPFHPQAWRNSAGMAVACLSTQDFHGALAWAERALAQNAQATVVLRALAVALVNVGEIGRAEQIVRELLAIEPGLTIRTVQSRLPFVRDLLRQTYADALGKAGLPS